MYCVLQSGHLKTLIHSNINALFTECLFHTYHFSFSNLRARKIIRLSVFCFTSSDFRDEKTKFLKIYP